ncbi:MAG: hypothetical protein AABZ02_09025, partial [Bacteroidota bacterium]
CVITIIAVYISGSSPATLPIRASILPPEKANFHFYGNDAGPVAISPDGQRLAFVAQDSSGKRLLFIRPFDALTDQPLTGTEGAVFPFWSPDNQFIGFFAQGKLKKIDGSGGPPITICSSPSPRGGSWSSAGTIVFAPSVIGPLFIVPAAGGTPTPITKLDSLRRESTHRWPHFLPDGKHFVYFARTTVTGSQTEGDAIYVASVDGKVNKIIVNASSNAVFASGHLLFARGTTLVAQRFDEGSLELKVEPEAIAEGVAYDPSTHRAMFSASLNGILVYQTGKVQVGSKLLFSDRAGKPIGQVGDLAEYFPPRLSPDGSRLAVRIFDQKMRSLDIWIYELARGVRTRFTFGVEFEDNPVWSPDGDRIVYNADPKRRNDLFVKPSSGAGSEEVLLESDEDKIPTDWSQDGKFIAYQFDGGPKTQSDIGILPLNPEGASGDRKAIVFLQTPFNEEGARFSPDGRWIVYASDESGQNEIYIRPFPGLGRSPEQRGRAGLAGKWQVSTAGGDFPSWRRDGREIYYVNTDRKLMAAEIAVKGSTIEVINVRALFELTGQGYDVTADGKRFLVNLPVETQITSPITLVVNWNAELKKK